MATNNTSQTDVSTIESKLQALTLEAKKVGGEQAGEAAEAAAEELRRQVAQKDAWIDRLLAENSMLKDQLHNQARLLEGEVRQPICVSCWESGDRCDLQPKCDSCVAAGTECVRKFCDGGHLCRRPGCPRIHPGEFAYEWQQFWTVEQGRLPYMDHRRGYGEVRGERGVQEEVMDYGD